MGDSERSNERGEHQAQKHPQPGEDEAQVVADRSEDGIGCIADEALEIAASEMTFGLHVTDHGFDGGAAPKFALDGAEHAALLTGDEDAVRI